MMSYQTEAHSNSAPSERTRRSEAALARTWNEYYALHGRIWGPDPSRTALELDRALRSVVQTLPGRRLVCDLGCGYGRDSIFLAGRGYDCIGVDVAETGLQFGQAQYETASDRFGRAGRVFFVRGTLDSAFGTMGGCTNGTLDGLSSHRTLDLMRKSEIADFATSASLLLRPGAIISIGARSVRDFDPARMHWLERGVTAEYHARPGQIVSFFDETALDEAFGPHFNILQVGFGEEAERADDATPVRLIFMLGQKRAER
jgi:SAM-dependent methyltransferase